jgi:hypothetical protein
LYCVSFAGHLHPACGTAFFFFFFLNPFYSGIQASG